MIQPRYWRCLPLQHRTGSEVFAALFQGRSQIATLLESPAGETTAAARYSICAGPPLVTHGQRQLWTPPLGEILPTLRRFLQPAQLSDWVAPDAEVRPDLTLPFLGGWLGWLGYDTAWEIEQLPYENADPLPFPVAYWYEPAAFAILDHQAQQLWLAAIAPAQLEAMQQQLAHPQPVQQSSSDQSSVGQSPKPVEQTGLPKFSCGQSQFEQAVQRAKQHIRAGDAFQVNHRSLQDPGTQLLDETVAGEVAGLSCGSYGFQRPRCRFHRTVPG
ncbi:MAG: hypothetical protein F6J97_17790, partial [Leptolyngbya sp. SIO4C1]|nr:hypothetical protein [Leptolyngbya sp. SIO4C1]